jgi:hypothetical protein
MKIQKQNKVVQRSSPNDSFKEKRIASNLFLSKKSDVNQTTPDTSGMNQLLPVVTSVILQIHLDD